MNDEQILELFRERDYMKLEEEGLLTAGTVAWAYKLGAISREEAEKLSGWFY